MGREDKFEFETVQTAATVRGFLIPIIEGLEAGRLALASAGEEILLMPGQALKVEVKAKRKKDGGKLELEISWKGDAAPGLAVGS